MPLTPPASTPPGATPSDLSPPTGVAWLSRVVADGRMGGVTLVVAGVAALIWANAGSAGGYAGTWGATAAWSGPLGLHLSYRDWVDQGVLLPFFALVGLEMRREITAGELRTVRRAGVPVIAALVGMAVPAAIYSLVLLGGPGARGWGIPMATDVAFALGALAFVGRAAPRARVFLMTLAVADDLASVLILVVFYSARVDPVWLAAGLAATASLVVAWTLRLPVGRLRLVLGALAWWAFLHAGVEAAVVGVALGVFGPARPDAGVGSVIPRVRSLVRRLEPAVNVVVLPLFALANVGIRVQGADLLTRSSIGIFAAVVAARVIGKPAGVIAGARLGSRVSGLDRRSALPFRSLAGVGAVASIGFTVPLLIIQAALRPGALATAATAGLLAGSVLGVAAGAAVFRIPALRGNQPARPPSGPPRSMPSPADPSEASRRRSST
jgi:NhaA family Na+:H+ antiporter